MGPGVLERPYKRGHSRLGNKKRKSACTSMRSIPAGRLHGHLANEQYRSRPEPSSGRFFLTFGETGRAPDNCICPLGKVLTYKNLIYLLNFPVYIAVLNLLLMRTSSKALMSTYRKSKFQQERILSEKHLSSEVTQNISTINTLTPQVGSCKLSDTFYLLQSMKSIKHCREKG